MNSKKCSPISGRILLCFGLHSIDRSPAKNISYLLFEFIKMDKALYHISIGLRHARVSHIAVIGCDDKNRQKGLLALNISKHVPSIESV